MWIVHDRYGDTIYLTEERWRHILESRPELEAYFEQFLETLRTGQRKQDALTPTKYRYAKQFDELLPRNTHLVLIVLLQTQQNAQGQEVPNNFVVTGWATYIQPKG
ncbi:MAG: hypothetical protein HOP18_21595 [Deltaproteobacteria bacterium]|nr:hypothetical protein [Deltaproteobacteria bacterium]